MDRLSDALSDDVVPTRGLRLLVPAIRLPADYARIEEWRALAADGVAGFLVFGGDDELLPPFLASLRRAAPGPLLICADLERGAGQQVQGALELPPLLAVGATQSEEHAYEHGRLTAIEARRVGIDLVLAPVADVLTRADNPIVGTRAFGSNPELVARLTAAWVHGAQDQGVMACAKHFPGHGDTSTDSHAVLPTVPADGGLLRVRELVPFRAAIRAGVATVMTAHVAYPALDPTPSLPATLSRTITTHLLREELEFGGLVLSDALCMAGVLEGPDGTAVRTEAEASVSALAAGCDLLLAPSEPYVVGAAIQRALDSGDLEPTTAPERLRLAMADLAHQRTDAPSVGVDLDYAAHHLASAGLTVLRDDARLLPLDPATSRRLMVIVVEDDEDARAMASLQERLDEFRGGLVRWRAGDGVEDVTPVLDAACEADVVVLVVACSIRAWKGRAGLSRELAGRCSALLERAGGHTVSLLLATPHALSGLDPAPRSVVAAWGDAPVCVRTAFDSLLQGRPLRGLDPSPNADD